MTTRPTILQVLSVLNHGGSEHVALQGAAAWVAAGGRSIMVGESGSLEPEIKAAGVEIRHLALKGNAPWRVLGNVAPLADLMRREQVAAVHWHNRAPGWSALKAAQRVGIPSFSTYHSLYGENFPGKRWWNSVMVRADVAIVTSRFAAAEVERRHAGVGGERLLVSNGVDTRMFDPALVSEADRARVRVAMGAGQDDVLFVLPARFTRLKGHLVAVEAMKLIASRGLSRIKVAFVGADGSPYVDEVQGAIDRARLSGQITILLARDDMPAVLSASDVVLSPSTERESFALVRVEAGAMARPLVATRIGAADEIVVTQAGAETGALVATRNAEELARAMIWAHDLGPMGRAEVGERARLHVSKLFDVSSALQTLVRRYAIAVNSLT